MGDKPNILMLVNDHQAHYRHGWDSGIRPQRPCFDRLIREGVNFERCYAVSPLCVPARTTLVTGLYPHNHKNIRNDTEAPYNHDLIFNALNKAGYDNHYFGKWHAGAGIPDDFGAAGFSREGYGNPYLSREYKEYLAELNLETPKRKIEKVFFKDDFLVQHPDLVPGNESYISDKAFSGENAVGISDGPKENHESFFLAHKACESLKEIAGKKKDNPFFMRIDFWGPHHPHFPNQEFVDMYDPEEIEVYKSFTDDLSGRPEIYRESYAPLLDESGKLAIPNALSVEDWKLICARAYAHITQIDAAGGRIIDMLDRLGLKKNTIVIWTTDHGDALASHGGHWDKGAYMTEEVMRVPFVVRYPSQFPGGTTQEALINTVDIPASIVDFAGGAFEKPIDGKSIKPLCQGETTSWREDMLCETYGIGYGRNHFGKALITKRFKFIWNAGDRDELYDIEEDPYEMNNLISQEKRQDEIKKYRERILELLQDVPQEKELLLHDLNNKKNKERTG